MTLCTRCERYEAQVGSPYCESCNQFIMGGSFGEDVNEQIGWEEYRGKFLNPLPPAMALAIADDELALYDLYLRTKRAFPTMCQPYREDYAKLRDWFNDVFRGLLQQRLSVMSGNLPGQAERNPAAVADFDSLMGSLHRLDYRLTRIDTPATLQTFSRLAPFVLRRILHELGAPLNLLYELAENFDTGSTFFWLEFFAQVSQLDILENLVRRINQLDDAGANRIANTPLVRLELWKHQRAGLDAWNRRGRNGIVEMATATGKTLVGLAAIERLSREWDPSRSLRVRVVCHSTAILNQWRREVIDKLDVPGDTGARYNSPIRLQGKHEIEIYFNTVQSMMMSPGSYSTDLLIADEVHHLGAPEFANALTVHAPCKLGLSATVDGRENLGRLTRQLGPIVSQYTLAEAKADGIIPDFEWILYEVPLNIEEQDRFKSLSQRAALLFQEISSDLDTISRIHDRGSRHLGSIDDYFRSLKIAAGRGLSLPDNWKQLQFVILERRRLLYTSRPKLDQAVNLSMGLAKTRKCLVYTMDIASAETISRRLKDGGVSAMAIHSELPDKERDDALRWFKNAPAGALVAPKILDEGIDVPDAEVGINVASAKSRLQLIQRLGRLLRKTDHKRPEFHHFVAVPDQNTRLDVEDSIRTMDDVSWAVETSQRLQIPLKIASALPGASGATSTLESSEDFLRRQFVQDELVTLRYGSVRIGAILSLYPPELVKSLIERLGALPDIPLDPPDWNRMLTEVAIATPSASRELPFNWYLYVLGGKSPKGIVALLQSALREGNKLT